MNGGVIRGVRIVTPGKKVSPGSIAISKEGIISQTGSNSAVSGKTLFDGEGELYAWPGFIDIHTHGAAGLDLSQGTTQAVSTMAEAKLKEGVTTFLPTTWTASPDQLEAMAAAAASYRKKETFSRTPFLHVEGPYLNPNQAGAQDPKYMRPPDAGEIKRLNKICPIKLVSLAVELEGALPFIEEMEKLGIVTSAAHSAAAIEEFRAARQIGLAHLTHFCNQMSGLHHRNVGLVGAGLLDDEVRLEMICDTVHLCEDMIELVFRHRSCDQIMLITDSIAASHLGDGEYKLGDSKIKVTDGVARIPAGNLAGSTLKFNEAVRNVSRITGKPFEEIALTSAANQAAALGLSDRGKIEAGQLGDIVLLDEDFKVRAVFVGGELREV